MDWFKFYADDLEDSRLLFAISKEPASVIVLLKLLCCCCRARSASIRWQNERIEIGGRSRLLGLTDKQFANALDALEEMEIIKRADGKLTVAHWEDRQSEYCKRQDDRSYDRSNYGYVYYAYDEVHGEVKIGFSTNPWARVKELVVGRPGITLLAVEKGDRVTERERHQSFEQHRLNGEWYQYSLEIQTLVSSLRATTTVATTVATVATRGEERRVEERRVEERRKEEAVPPPPTNGDENSVPWEWVAGWLKNSGADYTEEEARRAWTACKVNGWLWGKNRVIDWRAAIETKINDERDKKKRKKVWTPNI